MSLITDLRSQFANIKNVRTLFAHRGLVRPLGRMALAYRFNKDGRAPSPLAINMLVTKACNARCVMCCFDPFMGDRKRHSELASQEIISFVDSVASFSPSFCFSGGEPLVRRDLLEIIQHVKRRGMRCAIITNGILLTPRIADQLIAVGLDHVIVSLHGDRTSHDRVTQVPGSYDQLIEHLQYYCRHRNGGSVSINCAIQEDNVHALEHVAAVGRSAGVDHVRFEQLTFLTSAQLKQHAAVASNGMTDAAAVNTYEHSVAEGAPLRRELGPILRRLEQRYADFVVLKPWMGLRDQQRWYTDDFSMSRRCFFIWGSVFIKENGDVVPCQYYTDYVVGNIREGSFADIWNGERHRAFRRRIRQSLMPGCSRCNKL